MKAAASQAAVRIPLATAAAEEIAFRGALLGLLLRRHRRATAVASSSLLFGLWHLLPTLPAMRWYPIVTCWQVTADMAFSTRVPSGHGHAYGSEEAVARPEIAPPPRRGVRRQRRAGVQLLAGAGHGRGGLLPPRRPRRPGRPAGRGAVDGRR